MAKGRREGRAQDRPYCGRLRGRPGRLLAGPLAEGARHRGPRHPCCKRGGVAGAPACQDRLARHQGLETRLSWLAARRAGALKMCAIPTTAEEDAKRPHREREMRVGEQTAIMNRIKATLARLGIRNF